MNELSNTMQYTGIILKLYLKVIRRTERIKYIKIQIQKNMYIKIALKFSQDENLDFFDESLFFSTFLLVFNI